jgi:hypothetical protein
MAMSDIIISITEEYDRANTKTMVYTDHIVIQELNKRTLEPKFLEVIIVCKHSGLNVNSGKCMVMLEKIWKT